jgi:hypothetical protein
MKVMPTLQDYCIEHLDALRANNQANMHWGQYNVAPFNHIP